MISVDDIYAAIAAFKNLNEYSHSPRHMYLGYEEYAVFMNDHVINRYGGIMLDGNSAWFHGIEVCEKRHFNLTN